MFYPLTFYENVASAGNINNTKITTNITIIGASSFVLACSPFLFACTLVSCSGSKDKIFVQKSIIEQICG